MSSTATHATTRLSRTFVPGEDLAAMVDRITSRTVDGDRHAVLAATGSTDAAPVVTEP